MTMGERIKDLRTSKNMTLEELGNKVGVGKSTVRKWENGMIANMKRDKIAKIANALEVSPAYLMGWEDPQKNNDILADIVVKLRTDDDYFTVVKTLYPLDSERLRSIHQMLVTLLK